MGKKKKVPVKLQAKQAPAKTNPFELKGSKRKFDVLGKRDKDEKKNVIKSREAASVKVWHGFMMTCYVCLPVGLRLAGSGDRHAGMPSKLRCIGTWILLRSLTALCADNWLVT
jgi:hypothetical protein